MIARIPERSQPEILLDQPEETGPDAQRDPTPEEIREMCRRIREVGGDAWEKARRWDKPRAISVPLVRVSRLDLVE